MPYLRLLRGDRYHLLKNGDVPEAVWTRGAPVSPVELSAKLIRRLGLLEQTVPILGASGAVIDNGPRFELLERLPDADEPLDPNERLARLIAREDEGEGEGEDANPKAPSGDRAANKRARIRPRAPEGDDPTRVE